MKSKSELKIAFLGTPEFAVPSLKMLVDEGYRVCCVFTQPDRKSGRGHKLLPPPTKVFAEQAGIPVFQFERISRDGMETLKRAGAGFAHHRGVWTDFIPGAVGEPAHGVHQRARIAFAQIPGGCAHRTGNYKRRNADRHQHDVYSLRGGRGGYFRAG